MGWTIKLRSGYSLASERLLRFLGMHIHATQDSHLTHIIISGEDNDMEDVVSRAFQKGKFFAAKKISLHILKLTPPSHRGNPGPNSPFLPSGHYKWYRVVLTSDWLWVYFSGYQGSGKITEGISTICLHMEHWPLPPRLWPAWHHHFRHSFFRTGPQRLLWQGRSNKFSNGC